MAEPVKSPAAIGDLPHRADGRVDVKSLDLKTLSTWVAQTAGVRPERGVHVWKALWQDGARSFEEMSGLARPLRERLGAYGYVSFLTPELVLRSTDGTRKFLWKLEDGRTVESVLIPDGDRLTLCMSSQVGCAMGCTFCLTGDLGLIRHLTPAEIANQPLQVGRLLPPGERITNLVYMGMGEPLHNLENLCTALDICMDDNALNLSHRRITVSTVGLVPKLVAFAKRSPVNLAISLNSTTEAHRRTIMPITRRHSLSELLDACRDMSLPTGKRLAFEYVMFQGDNDSFDDAARLITLLEGIPSKVNLIPYNENPDRAVSAPAAAHVKAFQHYLVSHGLNCTIRTTRGQDISAACGQLGKAWEQAQDRGWLEAARLQASVPEP